MSHRNCGFCKEPGHTRRTCPAFIASDQLCLDADLLDDTGCTVLSSVGHGVGKCGCRNCVKYRKLNLPTPEIARQTIKEAEAAALAQKKIDEFPHTIVENKTRTHIYVYSMMEAACHTDTIEPQESYKLDYNEAFKEGDMENSIITDHDYDDVITYPEIEPQHILKMVTVKYGVRTTVTITSKETTKEDQWREAALKAQYLLKQLERLGVQNNPNYEPIMDMVQDIEFPEYSEQDKERAGVTSEFTNVHETTGIDEDREPMDEEP